jgi:hypothetical protein
MNDKEKSWLVKLAKGIALVLVIFLGIAIIGFGLLVGFCTLGR